MKLPVQVAPVLRNSPFWPSNGSAQSAGITPTAGGTLCACLGCGSTTCAAGAKGCACNGMQQCVCTF